jgi:hypothetical protein
MLLQAAAAAAATSLQGWVHPQVSGSCVFLLVVMLSSLNMTIVKWRATVSD